MRNYTHVQMLVNLFAITSETQRWDRVMIDFASLLSTNRPCEGKAEFRRSNYHERLVLGIRKPVASDRDCCGEFGTDLVVESIEVVLHLLVNISIMYRRMETGPPILILMA